ncbi:hypothetical protein SAMN02745883_01343 [Caminicella sporogenes DSM 14501]|uniref:Oligosaccharide repeat unit polymerase n=1 Tax=Caminicella sporogenes DSM 14501 TaxID=1121266 RepID=A0A1M6PWL3_9FIRM|nr:hypothetical protein [Caminicella sporogenes]RKD21940.1 hypothetical protein BET04_06730 [Caminicella sporogenes]SHK12365.1 hypothetical protein SAMN02745883_01343 [Caminicella sporogenes DSM 14501]
MNINKIKCNTLIIFTFLFIYKLLLDYVYIEYVNKYYSYMGFILDFNIYKYIISILWFVILFTVLPKNDTKPSSIFLQLHFIIMIMPMFTTYAFANESNIFLALCCSFFILECIILKIVPSIKLKKIKNSHSILYFIIIINTIFVYGTMIKANGVPTLKALNFNKVYEIRAIVKYPFLMSYLVPWQGKIINPFLITTSYIKKNKNLLAFSLFLQLILYLITAHKSFIFIPLAIIIVIKMLERDNFIRKISLFTPLGILFVFGMHKLFNLIIIPSLIIRRTLFLPSQLKFFYYDFFSKNELLYFSEGVIGKFIGINSPYSIKAVNLIGDVYFNNIETNANTGYLADAYANMGIFGMFIFSILFSIILILINSLSKNIKKEIVIGLSLASILALNDGALLTTLLTGGLLLLLLLLYLYSNYDYDELNNRV